MQAIGIDTGKDKIHVCIANIHDAPKQWEVVEIGIDSPDWRSKLQALIAPGDFVAIESTGYHYSAPLFELAKQTDAKPLEVHSPITGKIRDTHIAKTKNDINDARALALIALKTMQTDSPQR